MKEERTGQSAFLLLHSVDRKGLVLAIADFLFKHGGNILDAGQHQDAELGLFFMRIEWSLADFDLSETNSGTHFRPSRQRWAFPGK